MTKPPPAPTAVPNATPLPRLSPPANAPNTNPDKAPAAEPIATSFAYSFATSVYVPPTRTPELSSVYIIAEIGICVPDGVVICVNLTDNLPFILPCLAAEASITVPITELPAGATSLSP